MASREKTGVLVIRAWLETGVEDGPFRARITQALDVESRETVETATSSPEEVVRVVRAWLNAVAGESVTAG